MPPDARFMEHDKQMTQSKSINPTKWDSRWMDLAKLVSSWSKDRSRKCGAVVVDDRHTPVALGWNGFPRGVDDNVEARHERPEKYKWTEHAERNAIYNAASTGAILSGSTMYITWFPCCDCARGIIQSGIKRVVCLSSDMDDPNWKDSFSVSQAMMEESGIEILLI